MPRRSADQSDHLWSFQHGFSVLRLCSVGVAPTLLLDVRNRFANSFLMIIRNLRVWNASVRVAALALVSKCLIIYEFQRRVTASFAKSCACKSTPGLF